MSGHRKCVSFFYQLKLGFGERKKRYGVRRTDCRDHVEEQVEFLHYGQNQEFFTLDHCILRSLGRVGLSGY